MSYCRWSSDDFQCDIYCYADDADGWTVAVAKSKYVLARPLPPPVEFTDTEACWERYRAVRRILDRSELVPIDLPGAGKMFGFSTPGEAAAKIEELVRIGFRAPQYAIDTLWQEQAEIDGKEIKRGIDAGMT